MVSLIKKSKYDRILSLYSKLNNGEIVRKSQTANDFGVNARTIQRDIDDIRAFFCNNTFGIERGKSVVYDRSCGGYRMVDGQSKNLTKGELLAVCKILLESRSLVKSEMLPILDKLVQCCTSTKTQKQVAELVSNEKFHYIEPRHGTAFTDKLWDLGTAIREQRVIEIKYGRLKNKETVKRRLKPVGIMVSEFYFYLTAFIDDIDRDEHFENPYDLFPTIYRIDRIQDLHVTDEHFRVPYADKFEEGEFRKRVQFMYGGRLQTTRFTYSGPSIESVLDRLPTAKILHEENSVYTIEAETFGKGIVMWLRSQGEWVKVPSTQKE